MQAIRDVVEVKSNRITYELPSSFNGTKVELIILPIDIAFCPSRESLGLRNPVRASLRKYADPVLAALESDAWVEYVKEKYEKD